MEEVIAAASRALATGAALGALKRVALRSDPAALALRGIAMARLGDLDRARDLLRGASRGFGPAEPLAVARCNLAGAEIALVTRHLTGLPASLAAAKRVLTACGDRANAAHASCLQARLALLMGEVDAAEDALAAIDLGDMPALSLPGYWLVRAGIAMRRIQSQPALEAVRHARNAPATGAVPALEMEVLLAERAIQQPFARRIEKSGQRLMRLAEIEALIASDLFILDAFRNRLRQSGQVVSLAARPVLFGLARCLAEAWPDDVARQDLLARVFRARQADESHRARLRVEIARLRKLIAPFAEVSATSGGFILQPHGGPPTILAPLVEGPQGQMLALLADGEAWSSSGLALALGVSPRTVQRGLEALYRAEKVEWFGHGRARRWIIKGVPGFPTGMLLSLALPEG
ncbi:helix-turn-helix domain-containing protein [Paracoccus ravus]|uniref:helix-turn-helix domain-containing protein n=1 Tax=Paracoccus ravus TaxID=2447760 RepID=UPI00106E7390|nr:helix-turn-helix domain-containing protein [Paracoccus ravus]